MPDFQPTVNDLALFFFPEGSERPEGHWIPYDVLTAKPLGAPKPAWQMANLLEESAGGEDVFYVANLSKLLGPGESPEPGGQAARHLAQAAKRDLVIITYHEPDKAYLVPRATYQDPDKCFPIKGGAASDVITMALNQGVVLANLPKPTNITGWTCYLLSLVSLRSSAPKAKQGVSKSHHFSALHEALARPLV